MYLECYSTPTQRQFHIQHVTFRRAIAKRARFDHPINLKEKKNLVPKIKPQPYVPCEMSPVEIYNLIPSLIREPETRLVIEPRISGKLPPDIMTRINSIVGLQYNKSVKAIQSQSRTWDLIRPRHIAMYFCKTMTPHSLPEVGKMFGGRDHTTVLHAVRKITTQITTDPVMAKEVECVGGLIRQHVAWWQASC